MLEDVGDGPASTSLGKVAAVFEYFECFELLRPNEKRDEGAIVDVGENLEVSNEKFWGGLTERCSRNFELIVEGGGGVTKKNEKENEWS